MTNTSSSSRQLPVQGTLCQGGSGPALSGESQVPPARGMEMAWQGRNLALALEALLSAHSLMAAVFRGARHLAGREQTWPQQRQQGSR